MSRFFHGVFLSAICSDIINDCIFPKSGTEDVPGIRFREKIDITYKQSLMIYFVYEFALPNIHVLIKTQDNKIDRKNMIFVLDVRFTPPYYIDV